MKSIRSENAPAPIGPYSQAIQANGFLYVSGQIPIIPATGEMVTTGVEDEAKQVMKNLEAVLTEAGTNFSRVIKTTIFLKDMNDFATVNSVYAPYFSEPFPARETVEVARLPKDANVEIAFIALVG